MSIEKSDIEESFKNSDWSSICAALMPHFNDYLARRSKNVFECEQVNTLDHVFTVPALYDDMAGVRKQVIVPMKIFTRGVDAAVEDVKKATDAANTATAAANTATTNANTAATNAGEASEASKTQTALAKELNEHPTKMGDNGNWWMWNLQTHAYEDTGIIARGGAMYPTFRQSRNKLLMIDYGSNVSEHVVKRRNKLVIKV